MSATFVLKYGKFIVKPQVGSALDLMNVVGKDIWQNHDTIEKGYICI